MNIEQETLSRIERRLENTQFENVEVFDYDECKDFDWKEVARVHASKYKNEGELFESILSKIESYIDFESRQGSKIQKQVRSIFTTQDDNIDLIKVLWKIKIIETELIREKSIEDFKTTGLLAFVNLILHTFGWCIHVEKSGDSERMYPARTSFRGIGIEYSRKMYVKISEFMSDNSNVLLKESKQ